MKRKIKNVITYIFLQIIVILIILFFPKSKVNSVFETRYFLGGPPVSGRGVYWHNTMEEGAQYLCAEPGTTFFDEGVTYFKLHMVWAHSGLLVSSEDNTSERKYFELTLTRNVQELTNYALNAENDLR